MIAPYYSDAGCELYLGKMEEVLPALGRTFDAACIDPPYGETSLAWDRWPDGWPALVAEATSSMWCFGSMRMFLDRRDEFTTHGWKLSQDIVWEKQNGPGFAADRFRRVHEFALHWYRGNWDAVHHEVPKTGIKEPGRELVRQASTKATYGDRGASADVRDGYRLARSVLQVRSMHSRALHPTEKPSGILIPILTYACPAGGVVLDPFAGSGSTLAAAKSIGRYAVGIEGDEKYAEIAAKRLCQDALDFGDAA